MLNLDICRFVVRIENSFQYEDRFYRFIAELKKTQFIEATSLCVFFVVVLRKISIHFSTISTTENATSDSNIFVFIYTHFRPLTSNYFWILAVVKLQFQSIYLFQLMVSLLQCYYNVSERFDRHCGSFDTIFACCVYRSNGNIY